MNQSIAYHCPLLDTSVTVTVATDSVMDFTRGGANIYAQTRWVKSCTGANVCHSDVPDSSSGTPCPYRAILNMAGTR